MKKAVDLKSLITSIKQEQESRKQDISEFVETVEAVIDWAVITQPVIIDENDGKEGDSYIRLSLNVEVPYLDKDGKAHLSKRLLLFKNQVISAMLDNPELALYTNMEYLSSKDDKGLQHITSLLANRKITLAFVQLEPGDNYVDPATGIQFDTTTDRAIFKYSIVSIE